MFFLIKSAIRLMQAKVSLNGDLIKNIFLFCSVAFALFFYLQNRHYKSIISEFEERKRASGSEIRSINDLDKIVNSYLEENLNEDILLSSNDLFHLNRSIGLSN